MSTFRSYADACPNRLPLPLERRPVNGLNVEIGLGADRCRLIRPAHWPESSSSLRWLASGGSAMVFGCCSARACPSPPPSAKVEAIAECAKVLLAGVVIHADNVTAGNGILIDWRFERCGATLLEKRDPFDVAHLLVDLVGPSAAMEAARVAQGADAWTHPGDPS